MSKYGKFINVILIIFAILLFAVPFFWLKNGYVDVGGDGGRLYFLSPLDVLIKQFFLHNQFNAYNYADIPNIAFTYCLKIFLQTTPNLIAFDHGIQLSLAFLAMTAVIRELLLHIKTPEKKNVINWISVIGGVVYVGFITQFGWMHSITSHNQIFINPLFFYLLLRFCLTWNYFYMAAVLFLSILYSSSFGFSSAPQLFSFFPLSVLFLLIYIHAILHRKIPWRGLGVSILLFLGLHAFHLVPICASLFGRNEIMSVSIFQTGSIEAHGVHYFDMNHLGLGKISEAVFSPIRWHGQNILILFIPLITFAGFLKKPSKLMVILGLFFTITLFLVSANITSVGVQIYRSFFYLPGFMMFRSFNEKWYFVYVFFYTLLFAVSFYRIAVDKRVKIGFLVGCLVLLSVGYRIYPFFRGRGVQGMHYQSNSVPSEFKIDPDFTETVGYVERMPDNGRILTLPLTFPNYQVLYGKDDGAYVGISMISYFTGQKDYSGFWSFDSYKGMIFDALRKDDTHDLLQLLSLLNIRYVFHNTDPRIMDNFPGFPYIYPGELYNSKEQIPNIKNQQSYMQLLERLPMTQRFERGFFRMYDMDPAYVRPTVYIPDIVYSSPSGALGGSSFRSAYIGKSDCVTDGFSCDSPLDPNTLPEVTFTKKTATEYTVTVDIKKRKEPFLLILSEEYHPSWTVQFDNEGKSQAMRHMPVNGYANGWVIDPKTMEEEKLTGTIILGFQRYYAVGWIISGIVGILCIGLLLYTLRTHRLHAS